MSWKSNVVVAASVTALSMGVLSYTDPLKGLSLAPLSSGGALDGDDAAGS